MLKSCALAIAGLLLQSSATYALQDPENLPLVHLEDGEAVISTDYRLFRLHFSKDRVENFASLVRPDTYLIDGGETERVSAIAGQIDFHPFGDEFYLSAGAIEFIDSDSTSDWSQLSSRPVWDSMPHSQLADIETASGLEQLTRYLGAGIVLRNQNAWSLTMQGGAYFGDDHSDRVLIANPIINDGSMLLDDLDRIDSEAVGERHARHVKPVGHLVFRRRF